MKLLGFMPINDAVKLSEGTGKKGTVTTKCKAGTTAVVTYQEAFAAISRRPDLIVQEAKELLGKMSPTEALIWAQKKKEVLPENEIYLLSLVIKDLADVSNP